MAEFVDLMQLGKEKHIWKLECQETQSVLEG